MKFAVTMSAHVVDANSYDFLKQNYVPFLESLGLVPVLVPNVIADPAAYIAALGVEGLLLTGGGDIDPARYGQANIASHEIAVQRDHTESILLQVAVEQRLPVFCICRGMQMLNVFFGGGLVQDIPAQCPAAIPHKGPAVHPVTISDPAVSELLGTSRFQVNSYHHQGVSRDTVASDLRAFAATDDGIIEGLLHPSLPILGVQWHPERPDSSPDVDRALVGLLVRGAFWTS